MPRKSIPKYCLHKGSGQAYVKLNGKRRYLGVYGSTESREEYARLISLWQRRQDSTPRDFTVGQLTLLFIQHADDYYKQNGEPTGEADNFRKAARFLNALFRSLPVADFGPKKLIEVRQRMIDEGIVRTSINRHFARIKHIFKWGVSQQLVPVDIYTALTTVTGLRMGRSQAKESAPVLPVPEADFEAAVAMMTAKVGAMCNLLLLTGARVSEIRLMQVGDIDTTAEVWVLRPGSHKNAWRGKDRTIFIGPKGQKLLMPFLGDAVQSDQFVFRPRTENEPYTLKGLESSIRRACKRAKVKHWGPGRLRHNAATIVNEEYGDLDASRVYLGHSEKNTTQIYAERDLQKAAIIAQKIG